MTQALKQQQTDGASPVERTRETPAFTPRFDIWETDDGLVLCGDLPGVDPADLDIRFENRELTVFGRVSPRHAGRHERYTEYGVGDFYRTFTIGESIDASKISAELKAGVLTLHLPKTEAMKPKRIPVNAG